MSNDMHDSGKRENFESGAVRDAADGKPRPDLQSPYAQERIGHWLRLGAEKYAERNWEQGMGFSRCVASMERHLVAFKMGKRDEDHLAAIAVNAQFLMHYEAMIQGYVLPDSLDDMPHYVEKIAQAPELNRPNEIVPGEAGPESGFKEGDSVRIKIRDKDSKECKQRFDNATGVFVRASEYAETYQVQLNNGDEHYFFIDELTLIKGD